MTATLEVESTLTDRYQTTVPDAVRRALKLRKRDRIRYLVLGDGSVVLKRASEADCEDPVLDAFLSFLAKDIAAHPQRLRTLDAGLAKRMRSLVKGVRPDLKVVLAVADE